MAKGGRQKFDRESERTIADMLGEGSGAPMTLLDPSQFGSMFEAEAHIRGLGREHALVYDNIADAPIAASVGDQTSVGVPVDWLGDRSLTHNHPAPDGIHGGTFSYADMSLATTNALNTTRASSREGTYYIRPTRNANHTGLNRRIARDIPRLESRMRRLKTQVEDRARSGDISWEQATRMQRTVITGELHRYYRRVAPQYGFTYGRQKLNRTRR